MPIPPPAHLILIHGAANDGDAWREIVPCLRAHGLTVTALNLPGHGGAPGPALTSIEALADWVMAQMDAMALGMAALAGHSMGSLIALECAARYPQRVSHLALLGSTAPMPVADSLLQAAEHSPDLACRMIGEWSHTPVFRRGGAYSAGGHGVWGPGKTLAIMRRNATCLATDLKNCHAYGEGLTAAAKVSCPTLMINGRRDRMTPARAQQALVAALPGPQRCDLPECGHAMMVEQPVAVAQALLGFMRTDPVAEQNSAPAS